MDTPQIGIWLRVLAAFLITAMSALVREASDTAVLGQIIFWRSAVAMIPICIYMALRSDFPGALRTSRPKAHFLRGVLGTAAMGCSFVSLTYLPVAQAEALGFLGPVLILPAVLVCQIQDDRIIRLDEYFDSAPLIAWRAQADAAAA